MKAFPKSKSAGFTLIELMIGVAILGTLVAVGLPSFTQMLSNSKLRGAAESVANGIQRARAEAVSHNAKVQFTLGSGTSWYVDYVATPNAAARLDSRDNIANVNVPASLTVLPAGATTITFNQMGQVVSPNADASLPLTQITFSPLTGVGTTANQTLRVTIGAGGNARVCDPGLPAFPTNVRGC